MRQPHPKSLTQTARSRGPRGRIDSHTRPRKMPQDLSRSRGLLSSATSLALNTSLKLSTWTGRYAWSAYSWNRLRRTTKKARG